MCFPVPSVVGQTNLLRSVEAQQFVCAIHSLQFVGANNFILTLFILITFQQLIEFLFVSWLIFIIVIIIITIYF